MLMSLLVVTLGQAPAAAQVTLSSPAKIAELDSGKLKGEPTQLAWSDDGKQLVLQVSQRDGQGMVGKPRYFTISPGDGKLESIGAPPAWVSEYWTWKANKSAPVAPAFAIDIKEDVRQVSATSSPMGGALARGGTADPSSGTTVEDAATHAIQTQKEHVFTLTARGETVGEFVNQQFLPGYTFGWAPKQPLLAYGDTKGRLAVLSQQGTKVEAEDTHNVFLPAWSLDGTKIAFLQKTGKNKYDLSVVSVTQ